MGERDIRLVCRLMDLVDEYVHHYEDARGPLEAGLQRALATVYVIGAMRSHLNVLLAQMGATDILAGESPDRLLKECVDPKLVQDEAFGAAVRDQMVERGWVTLPQES